MDREVNETVATYLARIEGAGAKFDNGLLLGRSVKIPILLDGVDNKVVKTPVAWPLLDYKLFYIVDVPPSTKISPHSHNEAVFRVLISGDLAINGIPIATGEWFVVDKDTQYSIATKGGYKALAGYVSICMTNRATPAHLERS
jgi:hypothetical protein